MKRTDKESDHAPTRRLYPLRPLHHLPWPGPAALRQPCGAVASFPHHPVSENALQARCPHPTQPGRERAMKSSVAAIAIRRSEHLQDVSDIACPHCGRKYDISICVSESGEIETYLQCFTCFYSIQVCTRQHNPKIKRMENEK